MLCMRSYIWLSAQSLCLTPTPQRIVLQLVSSAFDFQTEIYCYVISVCLYSASTQIEAYVCPPPSHPAKDSFTTCAFQISTICCSSLTTSLLFDCFRVFLVWRMFVHECVPALGRFPHVLAWFCAVSLHVVYVSAVCSLFAAAWVSDVNRRT